MPLFHTVVSKDNHHFMGMQSQIISGTEADVQQKLDDFMQSPENGDVVVYDQRITTENNVVTVMLLYSKFTKKKGVYVPTVKNTSRRERTPVYNRDYNNAY